MATVFRDTFTGTDGTALTSHVPNTGANWTAGTASTSPVISNANRARTSGTGAADFVLANPVSALASHDYTVTADVIWMGSGGPGGAQFRLFSHGAANGDGYVFFWTLDSGAITLTRNLSPIGTFPLFSAPAPADTFRLTMVSATNSSDVDLTVYLQRLSDNFYLKSDGSFQAGQITCRAEGVYTDTSPLSVGNGAFSLFEYVGNSVGVQVDTYTIDATGGGFTTTATATPTTTGVDLTSTPSGGSGGNTFQWYRSTTYGFTPGSGNTLAGATTQNVSDTTAVAGTLYFYVLIVTDSGADTATSVQVAGEPFRAALKAGFLGDSIYANTPTSGVPPPDNFEILAQDWGGYHYDVTVSNQAIAGTSTGDWVSGSADLIAAKSAFASAGVTHVFILIGANDALASVSANTYSTQLASCVNDLVSAGYKVILDYPNGAITGSYATPTAQALIQAYQAKIDALVNGTTIYQGDHHLWNYSLLYQTFSETDGVHPSASGSQLIGNADLNVLINSVLYPSGGGGTGGAVYMVGGDVVYNYIVDIAKSDTVNIVGPKALTDAVYVGGAGVLVVVLQNDRTVTMTAVAGAILPIAIKRVNSGSTTATLMQAWYQV